MQVHFGVLKGDKPIWIKAISMRANLSNEKHDFISLHLSDHSTGNVNIRIPVEHLIAFHAAMVDALAPHVDEQRAAREFLATAERA